MWKYQYISMLNERDGQRRFDIYEVLGQAIELMVIEIRSVLTRKED